MKHIEMRHRFIEQAVNEGVIKLQYCPTRDMLADLMTKPLPGPRYLELREAIGVIPRSKLTVSKEAIGNADMASVMMGLAKCKDGSRDQGICFFKSVSLKNSE